MEESKNPLFLFRIDHSAAGNKRRSSQPNRNRSNNPQTYVFPQRFTIDEYERRRDVLRALEDDRLRERERRGVAIGEAVDFESESDGQSLVVNISGFL